MHTRATAKAAASFLDAIEARAPFPVRAIQVDGGSEFRADFEAGRAQRTHTEEFYEVGPLLDHR